MMISPKMSGLWVNFIACGLRHFDVRRNLPKFRQSEIYETSPVGRGDASLYDTPLQVSSSLPGYHRGGGGCIPYLCRLYASIIFSITYYRHQHKSKSRNSYYGSWCD